MFLTAQALKKIKILTTAYFFLGGISIILSGIFTFLAAKAAVLLVIGIVSILLGFAFRRMGMYSEGVGKLVSKGQLLLLRQLNPTEFIKLYYSKRDAPDNVVCSPSTDVLRLLLVAYDAIGHTQSALEVADHMISIAPEKKKPLMLLLKASVLYGVGNTQQAEPIYSSVISKKMSPLTRLRSDNIMKGDRAMAYGDYTTAEAHFKTVLSSPASQKNLLLMLYAHLDLAKIYYATNRPEEAAPHADYCLKNSGGTNVAEQINALISASGQ